MHERVALKVKITKDAEGKYKYPEFGSMGSAALRGKAKWVHCVPFWFYDAASKFGEADAVNPDPDVHYGVCVVCPKFADAALIKFPDLVTELTEAELEAYHDDRAMIHTPDETLDVSILQGLMIKYGVTPGTPLAQLDTSTWTADDRCKIDPDHCYSGCRRTNSKWAHRKVKLGITIRKV